MRIDVGFNLGAVFIFLTVLSAPVLAEFDDWVLYDDFNAKMVDGCKSCIDTEKWGGFEWSGDRHRQTEVERRIKGKRAVMSVRSWGSNEDNLNRKSGEIGMIFNDDPASITGVCFTPRIKKYELSNCQENPDAGRVEITYFGRYYDTNAADDDQDGVVAASFNFSHGTQDDESGYLKKAEFKADGAVWRCDGDSCQEQDWNYWENGADLHFGVFKKSNKTEFCVGYDAINQKFIFSAGDDEKEVTHADHDLPLPLNEIHPNQVSHYIQFRNRIENCESGVLTQYVEGDFDNVKVRRAM